MVTNVSLLKQGNKSSEACLIAWSMSVGTSPPISLPLLMLIKIEMNKTNIIAVSPNVTGNVGSCSAQSNTIILSTTFFTAQDQVTQINSCTGQVISTSQYTDYSNLQKLSCVGGVIILLMVGLTIAVIFDN